MSILIKGMMMPKNCGECKFYAWARGIGNHCAIDSSIIFHATIDGFDVKVERKGNCPLVELPPHGDLIDKDELLWEHQDDYVDSLYIEDAPTIIPAERGEE